MESISGALNNPIGKSLWKNLGIIFYLKKKKKIKKK